jgi:hypothetical protein
MARLEAGPVAETDIAAGREEEETAVAAAVPVERDDEVDGAGEAGGFRL